MNISNHELIEETFNLVDKYDKLNAFITLNKENAIEKAKALDNKSSDLALSGIPIAQKDLFVTKNLRTTCGSNILSNTYHESLEEKPPIVGITSTSVGTINPINPEIKIYKDCSAVFDVSDTSLSYVNQATNYSAFKTY